MQKATSHIISERLAEEIATWPEAMATAFRAGMVSPCEYSFIDACSKTTGSTIRLWVVFDDEPLNPEGMLIVYGEGDGKFGHAVKARDTAFQGHFIGFYESLGEAFESL